MKGSARRVIRSRRLGLLVLSLVVGLGAGIGAVVFRLMIEGLTRVFTGYPDYAAVPGHPHGYLPGVGRWFVLLTPVVAGAVYGPLVQRFAREARGHGVPEVMLAVARHGGRIRPQVAVVKALATDDHGLVFPSEVGTPLDPDNLSHLFSRICRSAGLSHWHLHELRHSGASLMLAQGTDLYVVSEVLGHSSIAITNDVYGPWSRDGSGRLRSSCHGPG